MTGPDRIVIVGAGGHGREILDVVEAINQASVTPPWLFLGFLDDGVPDEQVLARRGTSWLGGTDRLAELETSFVVGIGDPHIRRRIAETWATLRPVAAALVHPLASAGADVELGPGTVLMAGARLSTHITLGPHVHVGLNSTVHHDVVIGGYVTLAPGSHVCGGATVGAEAWIGVNASVNQLVQVGHNAIIGAGAAVIHDILPGATAVGVPAQARTSVRPQ